MALKPKVAYKAFTLDIPKWRKNRDKHINTLGDGMEVLPPLPPRYGEIIPL